MAYVYTWNPATPLDTADVSDGARVFREDVKGALNERLLSVFSNLTADPLVHAKVLVAATGKVNLDGLAAGDTYILESSANRIDFVAGGVNALRVTSTYTYVTGLDLLLDSTQKLRLDGNTAGDTYIYEDVANRIALVPGGGPAVLISATFVDLNTGKDLRVAATQKLYLDGGGDTYWQESSANLLIAVIGGSTVLQQSATTVTVSGQDFVIPAAKKIYIDGGGDTFLYESTANQLDVFVGNVNVRRATATLNSSLVDYAVAATKKLYVDGGGDTYIQESSANSLILVVGGNTNLALTATTLVLQHATTDTLGFFGTAGNSQRTVTGSRATGAALTSLLAQLAAYNLLVDGTTA